MKRFDYHMMRYRIVSMRSASESHGSVSGSRDSCSNIHIKRVDNQQENNILTCANNFSSSDTDKVFDCSCNKGTQNTHLPYQLHKHNISNSPLTQFSMNQA